MKLGRRTFHPILAEEVGKRIRKVRIDAGLSQQALADRVIVSSCNVSRWETGTHSPSLESIALVALALGIEIADLMPKGDELKEVMK